MDIFKFWTVPDKPPPAVDCFILLSYCVENAQTPTRPTRAMIQLVANWRKRFPRAFVIMSTGDNQHLGVPNSQVMVAYAKKLGIPAKYLIEEDRSHTTVENLLFSKQIADGRHFRNLTLVLYDLHVKRALAVAEKIGLSDIHWISATSSGSPAYGIKSLQTYSRLTIFLYEILAFVYNLLRGQV
jgi:uncharacterized SAM-binding protein YcdF (DUF218 family)